MPHKIINDKDEEIHFGDKEPTATQQDHVLELVWTDRTPMGSKAPVYTVKTWREVFSPALQRARLAEEKRIADEKQAIENARLTKNAKARMRRYLNKTFDTRLAERITLLKKHKVATLRNKAKMYKIDTKGVLKNDLAYAIANLYLKGDDERTYENTTYLTNFDHYKVAKGDAQ